MFGRRLGAPLADATYDVSTTTWTRRFASGTEVGGATEALLVRRLMRALDSTGDVIFRVFVQVKFNAKTTKGSISWAE